jgi:SAM-dependent methyltransferase
VRAPGELLPFEDDSFDTVVETLVLCTVADPEATAAEIRRVLKPDGRFLFMEHVRSDKPRLGRLQDRLEGPWKKFADGCHCNRRTVPMLRANGFEVEVVAEQDKFPMPPVARPIVSGVARPGPVPAT